MSNRNVRNHIDNFHGMGEREEKGMGGAFCIFLAYFVLNVIFFHSVCTKTFFDFQ